MTVEKLETAQEIIEEAGPNQIEAVYKYRHASTKKTLYAVFLMGSYVDIYESPFCIDVEPLFLDGKWLPEGL